MFAADNLFRLLSGQCEGARRCRRITFGSSFVQPVAGQVTMEFMPLWIKNFDRQFERVELTSIV